MKKAGFVMAAAAAAVVHAGLAEAVVPTECGPWYSPGGGFNARSVLESPTICVYELIYLNTMTPGKPIDLVFAATPGNDYTFSTLTLDTVWNQTRDDWDDYHFELGTGFNQGFANFGGTTGTPLFLGSAFSTVFQSVSLGSHELSFFNGVVPNGAGINGNGVDFQLRVRVPETFTAGTFTLRQYYSVPEPATAALLGLGLAGLAAARRRRRD